MKKGNLNILILASLFVYILLGIFFVFFGNVWTDEGWYFNNSRLVANGHLPYRDFFDYHLPLVSFIYAIAQHFFGPDLYLGRFTALLFSFLAVLFACGIALKLAGKKAALLTMIIIITNPFSLYYISTMSALPLEAFFITASIFILVSGLKKPYNYIFSVAVMALANSVRYFIMPGLWILLIFIAIEQRRNWKTVLFSFLIAIAVLGIIILPFFFLSKDKFIFDITWTFHERYTNKLFPIPPLTDRLLYLIPNIQNYFLAYFLIAILFLFALFKKDKNQKIISYITKHKLSVLIAVLILSFETVNLVHGHGLEVNHKAFYFPLTAALIGIGIAKILQHAKDKDFQLFVKIFLIILILISPFLQSKPWEIVNLGYQRTDIQCINKVARIIKRYTSKKDKIFTFTPAFAAQADREVLNGMELEIYAYNPDAQTEERKKFNLLNLEILKDYLINKEASILVLTEDRFFNPLGKAWVIKKDLLILTEAINKNYYLKEELLFNRIYQGNVYIYLPRE